MSGRDQAVERENRARERDRNREALLINVLRQHAQNRADRLIANINMANRDDHRNVARNVDVTMRGNQATNPAKRKCLTYGPDSVDYWANTEIEQETFSFLWSLRNYSAFNGSEEVKSPVFRGGPRSNHSWQLKMCPKKKSEEQEYFSVHLILTGFGDSDTSPSRKIKVRFQISILDADGRPGKQAGSATMNVCEFKKLSVWGYDKFILSTDLMSASRRLVEDDSLKIHCRVWIEGELKHKLANGGAAKRSMSEDEKSKRRKERLANDFGKIFRETVMTDIAITTTKTTFMAHKAILTARSTVFAAMFSVNMLEKELSTAAIADFDDDVVKGMLEYIYTGETELMGERAPDLLQIAEKYDLPGLKEDCEYVIAEHLTFDNAAEILVMAHLYNAGYLKPRVIDYINCNKEEVKKTKSFQKVTQAHPNVFVDLYLSQ